MFDARTGGTDVRHDGATLAQMMEGRDSYEMAENKLDCICVSS